MNKLRVLAQAHMDALQSSATTKYAKTSQKYSNSYGLKLHRPPIKCNELMLQIIKAIIITFSHSLIISRFQKKERIAQIFEIELRAVFNNHCILLHQLMN